MKRRQYRGNDVLRALNIEDLRSMAERRLPHMIFEYLDGGAEDELSLRGNREVFTRWEFVPRTLVNVAGRNQSVSLLGYPCASPLVIAPTGFNGMLRKNADLLLARSAKNAGIPFVLSTVSTNGIEEVAERVGGRLWFQLYPVQDRRIVESLVRRADRAGYDALVVTSDSPTYGNREWDQRSYRALGRPTFRMKLDVLAHPHWLLDVMIPHGAPRFINLTEFLPPGKVSAINGARYISSQANPLFDWNGLRLLREMWPRKLVVKGILSVTDALMAAEQGMDGIVLSNHGGRQLDGAISPIRILPDVRRAVGRNVTIIVDGGFRRGADAVKAIALGADAVMIGRAVLYGVAAGGETGATRALDILRSEIDRVLALLGCVSVAQLGPDFLKAVDP